MDDLESTLATFSVSSQPNDTAAPHPRFSQYKSKQSSSSQEERRRKFLEAQKEKRFNFVNHARALATNTWENESDKSNENEDDMDYEEVPKKLPRFYKNQLMLSEWLVTVPDDLSLNWYLVLCPVGKRSLVVASKKFTKAYSRGGYLLNSFPSNLPGGNRRNFENRGCDRSSYTLLDCIYCESNKTYYILDIMCWNNHQIYDCDTEFRFYWTNIKVKEHPEVTEHAPENPYRFIPLPYHPCDNDSIKNVLASPLPFPSQLDGLLFFHKKAQYIPGFTSPLICWLKAYMVPEILGIEVPEELCTDKPINYTTMKEHLPKAFQKDQERKEEKEKIMDCQS